MCGIISEQPEIDFSRSTRTVRIKNHVTSVQLENYYWHVLEAIADREELPLAELLNRLNDEYENWSKKSVSNFASMLRVGCVKFVRQHPDIL